MLPRPRFRPPLRAVALAAALAALALTAAGCGDDGPGSGTGTGGAAGTVTAPLGAGGERIPPTTTSADAPTPTVTTASGAPAIEQFTVPKRFWCLAAHPEQAQIIAGWHVPSATKVEVKLDGKTLHEGIRKKLPFAVPAGPPNGIGSTVVFPCKGGSHRLTIVWGMDEGPETTRTVKITKAKAP